MATSADYETYLSNFPDFLLEVTWVTNYTSSNLSLTLYTAIKDSISLHLRSAYGIWLPLRYLKSHLAFSIQQQARSVRRGHADYRKL